MIKRPLEDHMLKPSGPGRQSLPSRLSPDPWGPFDGTTALAARSGRASGA